MSYPTQLLVLHRAHCESLASDSLTVPEYLGYFAQWMQARDAHGCTFPDDILCFAMSSDDDSYTDEYIFMHDYVYRHVHGVEPPAL